MDDPPALRVLKLTGEVVVTLQQAQLADVTVRRLRTEIATLLGRHPEELHLILGVRLLDEDEKLSPLLPSSGVLDLTLTLEQLPPFDPQRPAVEQLQALRVLLGSPKLEEQAFAAQQVRILVSNEREPPIEEVVSAGLVPRLVELCRANGELDDATVAKDAAWILTNIASGTSEQTRAVVDNGGIKNFVGLLECPIPDLYEQAVWGLGNIAGDSAEMRDAALSAGCLQRLMDLNERRLSVACQENLFWTISNLCRGRPKVALEQVLPALPMLLHSVSDSFPGANPPTDALWALCYISCHSYEGIQAVLQHGVLPHLVNLLSHPESSVRKPALDTVLGIAKGTDVHKQEVLDCHNALLPAIGELQRKGTRSLRTGCYSLIAALAGGTSQQIQTLLDNGLLQAFFENVLSQAEGELQQACEVVQNVAARGTPEQMNHVFSGSFIDHVIERVRSEVSVDLGLKTFRAMLVAGFQAQQALGLSQNPYAELLLVHGLEEVLENLRTTAGAQEPGTRGELAEILVMLKGNMTVPALCCD